MKHPGHLTGMGTARRTAPQPDAQHTGTQCLEANLIAMDDEKLVFVDTATKFGGCDIPKEEPDQKRFERIAVAYLAESEVEDLTSIRYDIVSLLATDSEKAFLRHHKNALNDRR